MMTIASISNAAVGEFDLTRVRYIHVSCVSLSISLFVARGAMQFSSIDWRQFRLLRIAPHLVDTLLLMSALWLAISLQVSFVSGWLGAKLLAVLAYILIGRVALAPQTAATARGVWFASALACLIYIVGVAVTHSSSWGAL